MRELHGRTCILTGASRGIGAELARRLPREGLRLALLARSREPLEALAAELRAEGAEARAFPVDVTDVAALEGAVAAVTEAMGPPGVLVNNAGVEDFQHFTDATPAGIARTVEVNVTAALVLTRMVLPGMLEAGWGRVVNVGSVSGLVGTPFGATYSATKAALHAATLSLRLEYADRPVGFTAVLPGFVHGAGMHEVHKAEAGRAPGAIGGTTVEAVVEAVVRALHDCPPDIIVNSMPLRASAALARLFPRLGERAAARLSAAYMRRIADARR